MIYSEIIKTLNRTDNNEETIQIHKNLHSIVEKMDSLNFISKVIEENLSDSDFLNKQWTCFDIPFLNIFNNYFIDLKYHLFFPNKLFKTSSASNMIHSHKSSVLSSYVFYGKGYHTIHFNKVVYNKFDNYVKMEINKDFFHSKGNFNIVDAYEPHLISNVSEPIFTIALWTQKVDNSLVSNNSKSDFRSFYLENNKFKSISDSDFLNEMSNKIVQYESKDYHIQAICYFIQQIGYSNYTFLNRIQKEKNLNDTWRKWINKLVTKDYINFPYYNEEMNFINQPDELSDIRNAV